MTNPLTQTGRTGPFLRLVLAEAASYGMPMQVVATLDDVAAMLGYYDPLPTGQAGHLAGPLVQWRTDRRQPTFEHITDVNNLALKQRALIAFGGAPADHTVGTAEIVSALGNLHKETMPEPYYAIFQWASTDVLTKLTGETRAAILEDKGWADISDDEVLRPGGRLHPTYVEMATHIRRHAIAALQGDPDNPRQSLRPIAAVLLRHHERYLNDPQTDRSSRTAEDVAEAAATIRKMFPGIDAELSKLSEPEVAD